MNAAFLLRAAQQKRLAHAVADVSAGNYAAVFENGAMWMGDWMQQLQPNQTIILSPLQRFTRYGLLKYGLALVAFALAAGMLARIHLLLLPLAVPVFYAVEVHFLFLFPLLLLHGKQPLLQSIRMTYTAGFIKAIITVVQIAFFMLTGLLNRKTPFENWHIGCLAVLIWFYEIRNRLPPQTGTTGNTDLQPHTSWN